MPEKQNIEWKESWRDEYLKWICGFANAKGGKIFIGKDDAGIVKGLKNYKKLMEDIPNKIQNYLGILCDVNLRQEDGGNYIEIDVKPYDVPISYRGKYHYRSGSTKQELKGAALNEFLLKKSGKTWDDVVEAKAGLEDIDLEAVEVFKKGAVKSGRLPFMEGENNLSQILANLRLNEEKSLKRSAVLLFGKDPLKFFINAYIKIGKFGSSDSDLKFQELVESNAFQLADRTMDILVKKFLTSPISYEGIHRKETLEYPREALREAIINAVVHRDYMGAPTQISVYDDKLIIWNQGSLPEGLSVEDLKKTHPSSPQNPVLAGVFFKGGLIEAWGRGTIKIIEECKKAGLPEPLIESYAGGINVTLFKNFINRENLQDFGLSERQIEAVLYMKEKGKITNKEYQKLNSVSKATATKDLKDIFENYELIQKKGGTGVGTFYILKGLKGL